MEYLWKGTLGSILNNVGIVFVGNACATGVIGPSMALVNVQSILMTIMAAVFASQIPTWMQVLGLVIGILGSLVLTISDYLKVWFCGCVITKKE